MKKQNLRIPVIASALTIFLGVLGVLVSGPRSRAQSSAVTENEPGDGTCSNRTLRGDYGFAIEGQFLAGPLAGPFRGVALTHFDGEGNLSQVDHNVVNGTPPRIQWSPGSGTYAVNPDCTGTARIDFDDGRPSVHLSLVVVRHGREIHTVVDNPGRAVTSTGIKRDSGSD
jgi:hypothetical protein